MKKLKIVSFVSVFFITAQMIGGYLANSSVEEITAEFTLLLGGWWSTRGSESKTQITGKKCVDLHDAAGIEREQDN
jgi:hypothetical protein